MNRIFCTVAFIILCMWSCHNKDLSVSKPISTGCVHGSYKVEAAYDSTVKDLQDRINLSEAQIVMLRSRTVIGPKSVQVMNPQEPIQYKAENPPE
jgi:hypothetical protein